MGKGQSFIVEFILFFTISFSLFITISLFFHNQNKFFEERLGEKASELMNDIVSTYIINGVNCKSCERVIITENIPSKIGGFFYTIRLDNNGLNLTLFSLERSSEQTPVFNLNETFNFLNSESKSENKIVGIKINNIGKYLEVE
jgi:hypothetical protein